MHKPRVGDLGVVNAEILQVDQAFEMHKPRVGDLGAVGERECLQLGQALEVCHSGVGDLGAVEVNPDNFPLFILSDLRSLVF